MTFEPFSHYTNVGVSLTELPKDNWVLRDVYERILTGQLLDPHEACDLLHGYLEDGELHSLPTSIAASYELDADQSVEMIVRTLWNAAEDTALTWDSEFTDTDRFYEAIYDLHEEANIDIAIFSSIFDVDIRSGQRGAGALPGNAWQDFNPAIPTEITIPVDSRRLDILISEVAINVADAFTFMGLNAKVNDDYSVTITVTWRHHVLSIEDALEATSLLPR